LIVRKGRYPRRVSLELLRLIADANRMALPETSKEQAAEIYGYPWEVFGGAITYRVAYLREVQ
jgi:hypothetical protein